MSIKSEVRRVLRKMGYDVFRHDPSAHPLARRRRLLESYAIDVVLDVGANTGQFAKQMRRELGFSGSIVSFEPLSSAFLQLERDARADPAWRVIHCALGDREAREEINIAGNSYSSSLLDMLPIHAQAAPESRYVARETIEVRRLDAMLDDLCPAGARVYLKIDTQGYESKVLRGAERALERIGTIQLEMSLVPMYDGELAFAEMHALLNGKGFELVAVEPGFSDRASGRLLQLDGIYHRY